MQAPTSLWIRSCLVGGKYAIFLARNFSAKRRTHLLLSAAVISSGLLLSPRRSPPHRRAHVTLLVIQNSRHPQTTARPKEASNQAAVSGIWKRDPVTFPRICVQRQKISKRTMRWLPSKVSETVSRMKANQVPCGWSEFDQRISYVLWKLKWVVSAYFLCNLTHISKEKFNKRTKSDFSFFIFSQTYLLLWPRKQSFFSSKDYLKWATKKKGRYAFGHWILNPVSNKTEQKERESYIT